MAATRLSRVKQLARGTRAAAASLPNDQQEMRERAARAAEAWSRLADQLGAPDAESSASSELAALLPPAVSTLESLHFELLQVGVLEREPDAATIEDALTELTRLAEEAARAVGGSTPSA